MPPGASGHEKSPPLEIYAKLVKYFPNNKENGPFFNQCFLSGTIRC